MGRVGTSAIGFFKGAGGAMALAAAAISDPLSWLKALGVVSDDWQWLVSPWARQTIFVIVAFGWMFVWYHRQRIAFEGRQPAKPDMPMHKALRYIARDSAWAAAQPERDDDSWISSAAQALFSEAASGNIQAFGRESAPGLQTSFGWTEMPGSVFGRPNWHPERMVQAEPPASVQAQSGGPWYHRVKFNREQIERVWPKRKNWQRWLGMSPIERLSRANPTRKYRLDPTIFKQQDNNYDFAPDAAHVIYQSRD